MKKKTTYWSKISIEHLPIKKYLILTMLALLFPLISFSQTVYTFTAAGASGIAGPTQSQINTSYASTNLNGSVTVTGGIQSWIVPVTGNYRINASGARGGNSSANTYVGGFGANMTGEFTLTAGDVIKVLVGQAGITGGSDDGYYLGGGGGGGSYITLNSALLMAAGGGGGAGVGESNLNGFNGNPALSGTSGNTANGTNGRPNGTPGSGGNGGTASAYYGGGGGAGWLSNGGNMTSGMTCLGGLSFSNNGTGGTGGTFNSNAGGNGGFGGGGGGGFGGAGGGGYSGGAAGTHGAANNATAGGGGGSYNSGRNQTNVAGVNSGNGSVIITNLYSASISQTANVVCSGDLTGALSVAVNGGTVPYTYAWSPNVSTSATASNLGKGTYSVIVTDGNSLTTTASFTIVPSDNTAPVITTNGDKNVNTSPGVCDATVTVSATATDNCSVGTPVGLRSDAKLLSDAYPLGTTTITWNVTDTNGNAAVAVNQTVTVVDNVKPTAISKNITVQLNASGSVTVNASQLSNGSTDNCGINNYKFSAGSVGTVCNVAGEGTFLRLNAPAGSVFKNIVYANYGNSTGTCGNFVNGSCSASNSLSLVTAAFLNNNSGIIYSSNDTFGDPCNGTQKRLAVEANYAPATAETTSITYSCADVGVKNVVLFVTDNSGNVSLVNATITIQDNIVPVITSNGNKSVNADSGVCGANITVSASATDNCSVGTPTGVRSDAKALTAIYPVGTTTITWNVSDVNGNAATAVTQTVTVTDNQIPVIASNGNKTINVSANSCGATVAVSATATDNCTVGTPSGVRSDAKLLTAPYPVGTTTITWNVSDVNGNAATAVTQTVTVTDNQIPVIASNGDQTVNSDLGICGAVVSVSATATDNCTVATPTGVRSDAKLLTDVYPVGATTITWDVNDANGNAAVTVTQTVTVTDNEIPVIALNGDHNVNTDSGVCGANVTVSATATDNCTVGTLTGVRSDAQLLIDVYPIGVTTITWNVSDASGNAAVAVTQTVTVTDNEIPVIASNGDQTVNSDLGICGAVVSVSATATDNCTVGTPSGVRSDAKLLTDVYPVGATTITWDVNDANGNAAVAVTQTVTVTDNEIPVIASNGDQTVNSDSGVCGANVTVSATATDNCSVGTPTGVRSDAKALTALYPVGTTTITWDVNDANGNAAVTVTQTVTVTDNEIPVIASNGDQTVNSDSGICGAVVSVSATATDNCTVGTPTGIRSDAKLLTDVYPLGATTITWDVNDANGNAAVTVTQTVTVTDNEIPVIASNGDQTVNSDSGICGAVVSVSATATDNCTVANPTGVRSDAKLLTDVYPVGTTTITWNVVDVNRNAAAEVIQTVAVVDNQIPVIASNGDQNVNVDAATCGANITVSATATDNCTVGTPTGVRNDGKLLSDVYPVGSTEIKWNVKDVNSNDAVEVIQTVTVIDNQIPVITANGNQNVNADTDVCGANVTVSATATDNCTVGTPIGVRNDAKLLTDVYPVGITEIKWNVKDVNGNDAVEVIQTVAVVDNIVPTVITKNITVQLDATGNAIIHASEVDNNSSDNCTIDTIEIDKTSFTCTNIGSNIVKLTVTDKNGNFDTKEATVIVEDNIKPIVITKNITILLDASGVATIQASDVDDNSTDNCEIAVRELDKTEFTCANIGPNTVKLKVTDKNGNFDVKEAIITVENKIVPKVLTKNITRQLTTLGNVSIVASDIDNGSIYACGTPTLVVFPNVFTCANIGINNVTLTATDAYGNVSVKAATVTIEDKVAATVLTKDVTVQLDASGNASITAAQIDNGSFDFCGIASLTVSPNSFSCNAIGENEVTLTVTDVHGNISTEIAIVTVQDHVLPTAKTKDLTVELDASGNASITVNQINNGSSDNCGVVSVSLDKLSFDCTNVGINTVLLTVKDKAGNTATATAKVTVVNKFGDNDNDGILDNCDDDDDNDGIKDWLDNCPITANPYQEDRNNNGIGDACDKDQMNISEAFTPNGDGINDTWVISNIENHPNSIVRVFNRWGTEVFVAKNYQNDWDGHYKGSSSSLPESSSYYYQIDLDGDGTIERQGWIYINR
ncbi:gliding motility-associated C-terminal domain-containing protein [Flavobacterium sp. NPDC079362]|uniref:T9SS type B sorting domain-containing protein n=1 Tax=Flavobacterium sp. NPDC079362 TaxID=3390566 RepID=UPI003D05F27B